CRRIQSELTCVCVCVCVSACECECISMCMCSPTCLCESVRSRRERGVVERERCVKGRGDKDVRTPSLCFSVMSDLWEAITLLPRKQQHHEREEAVGGGRGGGERECGLFRREAS